VTSTFGPELDRSRLFAPGFGLKLCSRPRAGSPITLAIAGFGGPLAMAAERILFVDDDPVARRSFARAIRRHGFVVDLAGDGEQAWELASHFPYAVIATDLRMPGMSGMMLIEQLRELQSDPVCLLVTGAEQLDWYGGQSAVDIIKKPWSGDQLLEAVRQAVQSYHLSRSTQLGSEPPESAGVPSVLLVAVETELAEQLKRWLGPDYNVHVGRGAATVPEMFRREPGIACIVAAGAVDDADAVHALCSIAGPVPVVLLTRESSTMQPAHALRLGAEDCLPLASVTQATIARAVELAIERSRPRSGELPLCTERVNPDLLQERLRQALARARRHNASLALLRVGMDCFADVNQSLGFDAASEVLRKVGERLKGCVRESDWVFKLDGDEFALILEDLAASSNLEVPAWRVLNAFATPIVWAEHRLLLTASVGAASFPDHAEDAAGLHKLARTALEQAKKLGRNCCALPNGEPLVEGQDAQTPRSQRTGLERRAQPGGSAAPDTVST
jgi:diguanylate cyclase (GGDEF)-like protein